MSFLRQISQSERVICVSLKPRAVTLRHLCVFYKLLAGRCRCVFFSYPKEVTRAWQYVFCFFKSFHSKTPVRLFFTVAFTVRRLSVFFTVAFTVRRLSVFFTVAFTVRRLSVFYRKTQLLFRDICVYTWEGLWWRQNDSEKTLKPLFTASEKKKSFHRTKKTASVFLPGEKICK